MLGSAGPATASVYTATTSATPTTPTRPSRLRGLSYLRNYTHTHLHPLGSRADAPPPLTRSTSSPTVNSSPQSFRTSPEQNPPPAPSIIQSGEHGWIPTIQGRSGLSRDSLYPTSTSTELASSEPQPAVGMTRSRAATTSGPSPASRLEGSSSSSNAAVTESNVASGSTKTQAPTIRFMPHVEARSSRPSLHFTTVSRTLKTPSSLVRVGRYSERDNTSGDPNTLPVGFKSKVVSRRHCEFWCTDGQWYIKDVKSSSGTFLNHVRLSSPGQESRPYPVNDGDVVQLGIDFKGGEEVIFRCVKMRVECNRSWQKSLNSFNTSAHKRLFKNTRKEASRDSDAASVNSSECSICLNPVAPCQALFVAPCSHVWHYKCVRNLIHGPNWPNFLCPNCRAVADLDADVEQPEEDIWDDELVAEPTVQQPSDQVDDRSSSDDAPNDHSGSEQESFRTRHRNDTQVDSLSEAVAKASLHAARPIEDTLRSPSMTSSNEGAASSRPIAIAQSTPRRNKSHNEAFGARSTTPTTTTPFAFANGQTTDGPMTPRNDAGPFVFDGSAGRDRREDSLPQAVHEEDEPDER